MYTCVMMYVYTCVSGAYEPPLIVYTMLHHDCELATILTMECGVIMGLLAWL